MDKQAWRRWARDRRPSPPPPAGPVLDGLRRLLAQRPQPGWVLTYRALPSEVDVSALEAEPDLGPFALVRTPDSGTELTLHPAASAMERHRYGFDQPVAASPTVGDVDVAAVLVPGVAFDRRGHRLGHGAGYYDRLLARLPADVLRIGVTWSAVVVDELPVEGHDVAMTHVATERGLWACADP